MSQVITFTDYTPAARFDSIPWSQVIVEEAATNSGTWATIDTITLSPTDPDPSAPQARNITITNASDTPDLWYRLTFADDDGNTGEPSTPVQNAAAPTRFVSAAEFAARLGLTLTDAETDRANTLLALASGLIVEATGQDVALVEDDIYTAPSVYGDRLRLPQRPVVEVSEVSLTPKGGSPSVIDPNSYYLDGGELVRSRFPFGYEFVFGNYGQGWLGPFWTVTVTYTHGYADAIPAVVKTVCMEAVRRVWDNAGSVVSETIGDTQTGYGRDAPGGLLLTPKETSRLNDVLIGYQAGTVTLR
jgi:hypothetical protein